ncbi:hypothetical protein [Treponema socranskii]|uniref:hypothetical protein n=1 Tax=Treponema socranskii TaxID=53419 RepID=UPI0028E8354D|nr:hypothetical protein [Treponema socranskii]
MSEIKINENLSVKPELLVRANDLGVTYDFTFFQNGSQIGKVSAFCDESVTPDENGLPVVEIAAEECNNKNVQDFWEKYKDLWKPINYGKIRLLLRGAICALDIMQKNKNINT